jgi:PAS domain S-box-containing protein
MMFGLPPDADVRSISFRDRVHPEDQEQVNRAVQAAFDPSGDGTYRVECRLVWPDSTVHWFVAKGQAMFEGEGTKRRASRFIGTVVDITERKHAEQILREAEERFRTLATHAPVGIFHTDGRGACLFVNETWCEIAGATLDQSIGNGWARFVHPEDQQRVIQEWQDATLHRSTHVTQFRFLNHEKGTRWVIATATAILDAAGELTGFVGTTVDLTERKAIEDAVRESEARLRGILDHTPAVISLKDLNGRYVSVNRGWEELYGVKNEQMVGLTNEELLSKTSSPHMSREIADRFIEIDRTVLQTGELIEFEDPMPYGDDLKLFFTVKFPIKDASNKVTGIGGISIDITERRKAVDSLAAEQELLHHTSPALSCNWRPCSHLTALFWLMIRSNVSCLFCGGPWQKAAA